jgi:hypothetical protein
MGNTACCSKDASTTTTYHKKLSKKSRKSSKKNKASNIYGHNSVNMNKTGNTTENSAMLTPIERSEVAIKPIENKPQKNINQNNLQLIV